ncbi:hypothetical protein Tco_0750674 [Tanacetum coccineum]|uniref:Uncharacterized protein n=1 Tax=Tanacetum coccineum TaxID=301880 RepID=A0ABQ4Z1T7_9ASTR
MLLKKAISTVGFIELFHKLHNDVQNIHEELAEYINTPNWNRPTVYYDDDDDDDDDEDYTIAITHDILREKLLNVNLLIAMIKALKDNPTPSSDLVIKSDCYHEEFAGELAHIISPPEYDCFYFKNEPDQGNFTMDVVEDIFLIIDMRTEFCAYIFAHPSKPIQLDSDFILSSDSLGSDLAVSFPSGIRNKIFDPGIFIGGQSMIFLLLDEFSFSFIRDPPLPVIYTLLTFSSENENKVVNTGILASEDKYPPYSSQEALKLPSFLIIKAQC